ncbi:MAG: glycosyltransferase family 4 protein [Bacteroidetes bacterium]|nr:glycosyltransferase family 4 protein [Bacteroidota bacterium]
MNYPIKILYVHEPAGGGSLVALYELIRNLDLKEIQPYVICYYKNCYSQRLENIPGCKVFYLNEKEELFHNDSQARIGHSRINNYLSGEMNTFKKYFFKDKSEVRKIATIIHEIRPTIVHHNNGLTVNRSSIRAAMKFDIPQIVHTRGIWKHRKNSIQFLIDHYLSRKINKWIFYTKDAKNFHEKMFHIPAKSMYVFNDFIDVQQFHDKPADSTLRKELNLKEEDFIITAPGRIIEWKGQHILLEALHLIKEKIKPFKLLIVGSAEKGIGSEVYLEKLKQMVATMKIQQEVLFMGNRNDMPEIINLSNLVVHSAIKPEPQGLVIIEALFCRKKIVATDAGGAAELVHRYGGVLVKPGDVESLAAAIVDRFEHRNDNRTKLEEMQFEQLKSDFEARKKMNEIMDLYQDLLKVKQV